MVIRPFCAVRPNKDIAKKISSLPYDVYTRDEAFDIVKNNPDSFLSIDRAETNFDKNINMYDNCIYKKAKQLLDKNINKGIFIKDKKPCYYIYQLSNDIHSQTGIVTCCSIDDYINNTIKRHENTREDKEKDRIKHIDICNAQTGPIFMVYKFNLELSYVINKAKNSLPIYDFISSDKTHHKVWIIDKNEEIKIITNIFKNIPNLYIADGHHRCAAAVNVGLKRRNKEKIYDKDKEYNYILSVLFSSKEVQIFSYNRVINDLNGLNKNEFLKKVSKNFSIIYNGKKSVIPNQKGIFGMYINNEWYKLKLKNKTENINPIKNLDVSILQDLLLCPILNISNPRKNSRIKFIGGIYTNKKLEETVNNKENSVAFSLFAPDIEDLFLTADLGLLMPPKSTWFEPKLQSGLFIHQI